MSKYELVAFVVAMGTIATTIVSLASLYFKRSPPTKGAADPETDARLRRIEQAVDSIALEVERISEAQRFTAKLMAEGQRPMEALPARAQEGVRRG